MRWAALAALLVLDLVAPVVQAREVALAVPTFHLDGSFQTASGLFRLASGEWPGRDFHPYLGIGPVLLLAPVFAVLGGDLGASVFAAHLVTLLGLQLLVAVLAVLVLGRRSVWVLAWAAAVPVVLLALADAWPGLAAVDPVCGGCLDRLRDAALPGNSLRPLRALAPYLLAGTAYLVLRSRWPARRRALLVGVGAGAVAAVWSNDYGLVSGGLLLVVVSVHLARQRETPWPAPVAVLWAAALGSWLVTGFVATAGHFVDHLAYNFSDVRGDQMWYFGALGEESVVFSVGDLVGVMAAEHALVAPVVLAGVLLRALLRRDVGWSLVAYVGVSVLLGGVVATVGGHAGGYFWALALWGDVVVVLVAVRLVHLGLGRLGRAGSPGRRRAGAGLRAVLAVATVVALVLADRAAVTDSRTAGRALAADPAVAREPGLGGYLGLEWRGHLDLFRDRQDAVVEEYMGLAGALVPDRNGLPVDSVIAALGEQRDVFAERMAARPDVVVTTAPEVGPLVTWSLSANWWFYRTLFRSYAPARTSPTTLVWTPVEPASWQGVPCRVRGDEIVLGAPTPGLYEVTLDYRGPGAGSREYSMVQNNISLGREGFLPLDPGAGRQQFPVAVHDAGAGSTTLGLRDVSAGREPLTTLESCRASAVTPPEGAGTLEIYRGIL
ncbi:hypothetical protein [Geodermatophilus sp. SYSU D00815]